MEATERLGGQYSPNLHPQCTHLVVQISFDLFRSYTLYSSYLNHFSTLWCWFVDWWRIVNPYVPLGTFDVLEQYYLLTL